MSYAGIQGEVPQQYFCYECNRTVSITLNPSSELVCPTCNGDFLEELEPPNPNPNPNPFFSFSDDPSIPPSLSAGLAGIPLLFSSSGSMNFQPPTTDFSALFGPNIRHRSQPEPDVFNPFMFLQNYLHTLRAGGANIQFVVENTPFDMGPGPGGAGFRLPANLGDYFIGPGLEQLIQQLAENDPNRYGTPPAAKTAVQELPSIKITEELLASDSSQCAVCKDEFDLGVEARQMPCKHIYHPDCILPWLELHNSCPVCRYELPTDDPEYENRAAQGAQGGLPRANSMGTAAAGAVGADSVGSGATGQDPSPSPRRFRISFPWPFGGRAYGSPAETSNNDRNNDSGSGGSRGNPNFGAETRQEDLD